MNVITSTTDSEKLFWEECSKKLNEVFFILIYLQYCFIGSIQVSYKLRWARTGLVNQSAFMFTSVVELIMFSLRYGTSLC